jgi:hypothetical protein
MIFQSGLVLLTFLAMSFFHTPFRVQATQDAHGAPAQSNAKAANAQTAKKQGWITDRKTASNGVEQLKTDCPAKCRELGDTPVLVTKDAKIWEITTNRDTLKGHEGHLVEIDGTFNSQKGQVQIESLANLACGSRFCERKCKGKCGNGTSCDCEK